MSGALQQMFGGLFMKRLPLVYCCQMCSIRTDARRSVRRNRRPPSNPGIDNRLKILKMDSPDFEKLDQDEIEFDELESDFMQAGKMHVEYERERKDAADSLAYVITKSKHFKPPKLPNFLMWSEKEQIRNLHQLDAIQWSPENLSQHFPATPEIVLKLIKSHWKPRYDSDIERHDRSVQKNWSALLQGKFNLDKKLKQHLLSFSTRQHSIPKGSSSDSKQVTIHNKPQGSTEFSDIVNNFSKEKNSSENKHLEVNLSELSPPKVNIKSCDPKSDSYVVPSRSRSGRELLPLKEYKEKVLSQMDEEEEEGDELARKYYDHLKKGIVDEKDEGVHSGEGLQVEEKLPERTKMLQKYQSTEGENLLPQQLEVYMKAEQYRLKIKIPREKFDPSAVYKVKDCFYDADGKFLYRVPGMG